MIDDELDAVYQEKADTLEALEARARKADEIWKKAPWIPLSIPTTIEQSIEQNAEDGTHSILDIRKAYPLTADEIRFYFGTDKPTRVKTDDSLKRPIWNYHEKVHHPI